MFLNYLQIRAALAQNAWHITSGRCDAGMEDRQSGEEELGVRGGGLGVWGSQMVRHFRVRALKVRTGSEPKLCHC